MYLTKNTFSILELMPVLFAHLFIGLWIVFVC